MQDKIKKPLTIILVGPSGSGKGTQARLLMEQYSFEYVEMGTIIREKAKEDSELGKKVYQIVQVGGKLLPDEVSYNLIKSFIENVEADKNLIIDGYPRTLKQVKDLNDILKSLGRDNVVVLNVDLSEEEAINRLSKRLVCRDCKDNSVESDNNQEGGKCIKCGGELYKREDDTPEKIKERLSWAKEKVRPVIEKYGSRGMLIDIDGSKSESEVYDDVVKSLKEYL